MNIITHITCDTTNLCIVFNIVKKIICSADEFRKTRGDNVKQNIQVIYTINSGLHLTVYPSVWATLIVLQMKSRGLKNDHLLVLG